MHGWNRQSDRRCNNRVGACHVCHSSSATVTWCVYTRLSPRPKFIRGPKPPGPPLVQPTHHYSHCPLLYPVVESIHREYALHNKYWFFPLLFIKFSHFRTFHCTQFILYNYIIKGWRRVYGKIGYLLFLLFNLIYTHYGRVLIIIIIIIRVHCSSVL